jgi:5-oxoprolinase (ATP-hydrolysing)
MNNLTFGIGGKSDGPEHRTEGWGYYETIAGGAGAGPGWAGASGVHTHMTNTRITDAESTSFEWCLMIVLERRYPVILRRFSLRPGSGGRGKYPGGDGIVRDIEFRIPCQVSILSERRVHHPYGLHGGEDARYIEGYVS